jgi:hypothetical protein
MFNLARIAFISGWERGRRGLPHARCITLLVDPAWLKKALVWVRGFPGLPPRFAAAKDLGHPAINETGTLFCA